MRGVFNHMISHCKSECSAEFHKQTVAVYGKVMNQQNVTKWCCEFCEKVRRWCWGARRSHDMVQRGGGRLLWLRDTEPGSKT